ncbi:hypothetical protein [Terrabacter carboxydivorans]|uniref:Uncharacterized protein n=1 Tax=Terrabacter carboxydivorans TaxID=619730 RepID=A0ABN3KT98_9MICO
MSISKLVTKGVAVAVATAAIGAGVAAPANAAGYKCETSGTTTYCYQVTSTAASSFVALYTDALVNSTSSSATLTCSVEYSKSYTASATATVSTSIKAFLVASVDASVSATVTNSVTTTIGSSVTSNVPAHTTRYCDRGTYTYRGTVLRTGASGMNQLPNYTFSITAPAVLSWRFR